MKKYIPLFILLMAVSLFGLGCKKSIPQSQAPASVAQPTIPGQMVANDTANTIDYSNFFPYNNDYLRIIKYVPEVEIDLNKLTSQQQEIINMVTQYESRLRDINEPITITGVWLIHNEPNHYKIMLTRPVEDSKGGILYMSTHYYDVLNDKIRGLVSLNNKGEVKSVMNSYLFSSEAQYKLIVSCIDLIKQKENIDLTHNIKSQNQSLIMPNSNMVIFNARTESGCYCKGIGCCDDFIPEVREYKFICELDTNGNITLESN